MIVALHESLNFNIFLFGYFFKYRLLNVNSNINFDYFFDRNLYISGDDFLDVFLKNGVDLDRIFNDSFNSLDVFGFSL